MRPNTAALLASILFGLVVLPWSATLRRLGPAYLFLFVGTAYVINGLIQYLLLARQSQMSLSSFGLGILTALLYVGALTCCNYAFGHPEVNLPVAAAITAVYPIWSAVISFVFLRQKFSPQEVLFLLMAIIGVVGLSLSSKQQ